MAGGALLNPHALLSMSGVQPGMCVIEFGAGHTGHLLVPASKWVGAEGKVYGVSVLAEDMDRMCGHPGYEAHDHFCMVRGDYFRHEGVPLECAIADRVYLVNQLYSISDLESVLHEVARLLKTKGELWLVDWRWDSTHPVAPPLSHRKQLLPLERQLAGYGLRTTPRTLGKDHMTLRVQFS